jgi:hypothetical protein
MVTWSERADVLVLKLRCNKRGAYTEQERRDLEETESRNYCAGKSNSNNRQTDG